MHRPSSTGTRQFSAKNCGVALLGVGLELWLGSVLVYRLGLGLELRFHVKTGNWKLDWTV